MPEMSSAVTVMMGMAAFFRACLYTMVRRERPLAVAVWI